MSHLGVFTSPVTLSLMKKPIPLLVYTLLLELVFEMIFFFFLLTWLITLGV